MFSFSYWKTIRTELIPSCKYPTRVKIAINCNLLGLLCKNALTSEEAERQAEIRVNENPKSHFDMNPKY